MTDKSFRFHDLASLCVVVTGAAMGIGKGLAHGLAAQGTRLMFIDRDETKLSETVGQLRRTGSNVDAFIGDLGDAADRERIGRAIADSTAEVHGIIHNAAIDPRLPLDETTIEFFRRVVAVDVEPAIDLTRHLLPKLRASKRGRVILIGSITFDEGPALMSAYVAAKGAIVGLTRSMAHELGPDGITVNCISPGVIRVEKESRLNSPGLDVAVLAWQSVKRRLVPEDLVGLVCLLLSDAGAAISGQIISVDGGFVHPLATAEVQRPMTGCVPMNIGPRF